MTIRPRQLRAVIAARGRLRDLASAVHAQAQADEVRAAEVATTAAAELDEAITSAAERMATSAGVAELMRIAEELAGDRANVDAAHAAHSAAGDRARQSAAALRSRERELRTVERVLEDSREQLEVALEKGEQRATDDRGRRRAP